MPISLLPLPLVALLAAAPAAPAPAPGGFLFERDVDVPAPGWVRVPLDLAAVRHLAPEGTDLHVFAPGGAEVPARVEPRAPRSARRPVQVVGVERGDEGWTVLLDVGATPVSHERLFFEITKATAAPSVRLEGSRDRSAWQTLTVGDLFRLGTEGGLQRTALSYPATDHRWLRLFWPREAGFPRVSAVEVETVSGPTLTFAARGAPCRVAGPKQVPATVCELALPGLGQVLRRLTVDLEGGGAVGYRLDTAADGAWHPLAQGVWRRTEEKTRHLLPGDAEPLAGAVLRLELYGEGVEAPRLAGYAVDLAVQTVLFRAEEPGRYTVTYGGAARRGGFDPPAAGEEEAWLDAGPERERPAAPLPAGAPGAPLGTGRFRGSWRILAPAARPGDLARLELPDTVYGVAQPDLRDVRLAFGDLQVPFFLWSSPDPVLAAEAGDLRPRSLRREHESEAEVDLPVAGLPLTQLFLVTPGAGPLRRIVGVRYRPRRPVTRQRERGPLVRETWECDPEPPLPCRAGLALRGEAPEILAVRVDDGDDPPLAHLGVEVWRRRDVLLFVWPSVPEGGEVRLLAGARDLAAPDYDFAALGPVLLARPWRPAELDLGEGAGEDGAWWGRWILPAALGVAAVFLLLLLRRILAEPRG
ncbi:MAG TPA: DUF3999 family protein [Thermoanaerobaculia bacterium]|nr:DUF3999 family protein [Thermoanaerobaculia bacterium]